MKITFIGLSSFLIENEKGFRVLIDPFNPAPEWTLGASFPSTFRGKPFGANIVLMSEPDADHAYAPGDWLQHAPRTKPNDNPFPNFNLRGTVVYEHNGDLNIAWHYTVDGIRLAHFADNSHVLTADQLSEIGQPDIVFMAPPKADGAKLPGSLNVIRKNIEIVKPKIVIWTHHLAPKGLPEPGANLRDFFSAYFKQHASTNAGYKDETSFMELCYCLENAMELEKDFRHEHAEEASIVIDQTSLERAEERPIAILFRAMTADPANPETS